MSGERSRRAEIENLEKALGTMDLIVQELGLGSDTRKMATNLYQSLLNQDAEHSHSFKSIKHIAAACLYLSCKAQKEGVAPSQIVEAEEGIEEKIMLRRAKSIRTDLGLDFIDSIADPQQYVDQYAEKLNVSNETFQRANEILAEIQGEEIVSGKNPRSIAAAVLYNASIDTSEGLTMGELNQSDIAEVADVTEVTIRNRYQEQREYLGI